MGPRSIRFVTFSALGAAFGCTAAQSPSPVQSAATLPLAEVVAPRRAAEPLPKTDLATSLDNEEGVADAPMVSSRARGWLGVALRAREPGEPGVFVQSVLRGSPAASAGLEVGDVVLSVDSKPVSSPSEMVSLIAKTGAGNRASLMLKRDDQHKILAVPLAQDPGPEGRLRLGYVNEPAPQFSGLEVVQGGIQPELAAFKGRVVVLEFWATWCVACRALLPALNAMHERYDGQATVVGVTMEPVEKAQNEAFQLGLRYPVLSDPEGVTSQSYQAYALPTVFVIDRDGVVRDVFVGYDPDNIQRMQHTLDRLVHEG
jgi:thiol-disulfide isomerase/thioredoxin